MGLPNEIADLIERFDRNLDNYKDGQYNEAQLRQDFLNPFLGALGWDMTNKAGYAEAYRDVIHEDAIKIGGATKAPDYCFRIGGVKKFFVEAKKPSVNLKDDVSPAFQLRRYAWSAKLPLSILTDFEEFAVYDCRIKPVQTDKASTGRILYFTYKDYPAKWDELVSIFSPTSVQKGSFDRYAESSKLKKGTATVDDAFLTEIEGWRDLLARNIAIRNTGLSPRELNFAVQRTIDRIVFLRICEDRGIEEYGRLQTQLNGTNVYKRLVQLFSQADDRYNSGLFHFQREKERHEEPDKLTPNISIDDKPLKDIINRLYYPESPYEFSVLSADILGQVYEQFLGKVIRLTAGHQAKVEEKPEVRKAGGVYYTPKYIVDYIVKNTVGQLLNPPLEKGGKGGFEASDVNPPQSPFVKGGNSITPKEASKLRILDPACGSGSFLLGAYQYLLDWHLKWYIDNEPDKWAKVKQPSIYQGPSPDPNTPNWNLTTSEKKRILLNNIYGVDIDSQAVEVTKLSLLLKVLEGENNQTLANQLRMFHERALPDLGDNIKCGNSLIGPDFYQQQTMLDDEERYRVNVFDWEKEFSEIMKAGGFDSVIGNPPYSLVVNNEFKQFYENSYETTEGRFDTFELFIEKGIKLSRKQGLLGYIVPSPLLTNLYSKKLRKYIVENCLVHEIVNFGINVFTDPTIHTCIIIVERGHDARHRVKVRKQVGAVEQLSNSYDYELQQSSLGKNTHSTFDIFVDPFANKIIERLEKNTDKLGNICYIRQCIKTGDDTEYVKSLSGKQKEPWKPTLRGRSIARYATLDEREYLKYGPWLARNWQNKSFYETPKIAIRETGKRIIATIDLDNRYFLSSLYAVYPKSDSPLSLQYILGLLNSVLATYYLKIVALNLTEGAFTKFRTNQLARFPIRVINFLDPKDKARHAKMVSLVELILSFNKQLLEVKTDHEMTTLQRQIDTTDQQIDQLVYELYGLTEEEIKIVVGDT